MIINNTSSKRYHHLHVCNVQESNNDEQEDEGGVKFAIARRFDNRMRLAYIGSLTRSSHTEYEFTNI